MHDLVIRGGKVIDGTGAPARELDVVVDGDQIVAMGEGLGPGQREIDAKGLLVLPGWWTFIPTMTDKSLGTRISRPRVGMV